MARKFAAVVLSLGCLNASSALALGLGEIELGSYLNEPLRAEVNLLNTGNLHEDQIRIRLATKDDFEKMGVDRAYFLTSIKFEVKLDASGRGQIIMTSDDPVLEPYLDFIVEARWPSGRLLREYTVLVDPPVFDESAQVISATARVIEVEGETYLASDLKKKETETAVQRSGTHVDVRNSDLPPGQMPEREFGSQASDSPTPGARYMIRRDETLWEIAQQAQPQGATVHQTMLDIQRLNPRAFIDGNINRIKAGYVVYLPASSDISSNDQSSALASVRQQNEDWREGKASTAYTSSGPSLRIAADTEGDEDEGGEAGEQSAAGEASGSEEHQAGASAAAMEDMEKAELADAEAGERLASMEQQVETLQRIVSLKDEQIAALQNALAEAGQGDAADELAEDLTSLETPQESGTDEEIAIDELAAEDMPSEEAGDGANVEMAVGQVEAVEEEAEIAAQAAEESVAPAQMEPAPEPVPTPAPVKAAPEQGGGLMSYLFYGLGALVLAILGFLFLRRRGAEADDDAYDDSAAVVESEDVFADVELKDQNLEVADIEAAPAEDVAGADVEVEPETEPEQEQEEKRDSRGYGERKHDDYSSDVDTGDALAEADIYVAYGRYPQAIDLLKNAAASEPGNTAFILKLMEIFAEMDDRDGVMQQLADLEKTGDAQALSQAEQVLAGMETKAAAAPQAEPGVLQESAPEMSPEPASKPPADDLGEEPELSLESDFGGLEIEETVAESDDIDELDLSGDFVGDQALAADDGEDLVIAAEANDMSTKLDLARAYLDMGDEDGARQILEEVVAEGDDDLKAEARALLDRIG